MNTGSEAGKGSRMLQVCAWAPWEDTELSYSEGDLGGAGERSADFSLGLAERDSQQGSQG